MQYTVYFKKVMHIAIGIILFNAYVKLIALPYPYSYEQHSCCSMQQPQGDEEFKPGATVPPASA